MKYETKIFKIYRKINKYKTKNNTKISKSIQNLKNSVKIRNYTEYRQPENMYKRKIIFRYVCIRHKMNWPLLDFTKTHTTISPVETEMSTNWKMNQDLRMIYSNDCSDFLIDANIFHRSKDLSVSPATLSYTQNLMERLYII